MAIARKPKSPQQPDEAAIQQLINKGGSPPRTRAERGEAELSPVLLRIPSDMLAKIDDAVQRRRPVRISRQAWIIETLQQRLKREE